MKKLVNGELVDFSDEDLAQYQVDVAQPPPVKTKVYKADVWRRASDTEAAQIDALLKAQPIRIQRLWDDAQFLSTSDELFTQVHQGAVSLFGEERAGQLLQPTE